MSTMRSVSLMARRTCCGVLAGALALGLNNSARAGSCTITPSPYWENIFTYPDDPFRVLGTSAADPGWVKFTILTCDPAEVYFQDSNEYTFHYTFATTELDPFIGMTPQQYDLVTLHQLGQLAMLGAVVLPPMWGPGSEYDEYGISLVRQDPYTAQEVVDQFNLVKSKINAEPGVQAFYFPTFEQAAAAEANRAFLEANGIIISSPARWADGNVCYSEGWALGELKFFEGAQIQSAYLAGLLEPGDILLTDGVPAEIPFVAGVMTLTPSTPNSHVAILANTFNVPFLHLALQSDAARALELVGRKIVLRAYTSFFENCQVRLIDVEDTLTDLQIEEILELKQPPPLNISPMAEFGGYSASTDALVQSDIQYFGGKAANFGTLRRSIPSNSPIAAAFSFDLWNAFLDQTVAGGNTLRQEIDQRLAGFTYPPNMAALAFELVGIRDLFDNESNTSFSVDLQNAVILTLQRPQYEFDPLQRIRFRSSTNVEDSDQFTGAGLYDSKSGCLADDLDGDSVGPSWCNPSQAEERGVFRAIRKVFASFYNDNAYLERLRYGIDESQVGMAILAHHSFPDEIELANGVAEYAVTTFSDTGTLVTQLGAVSVSNPTDGSISEEVEVYVNEPNIWLDFIRESNLVQLGDTVMEWDADYLALVNLLSAASQQYALETGKTQFVLDFEYKKMAPGGAAMPGGGLVVKQIREIPQPDTTPSITPFLINQPTDYCIYQGESGEVFANHRLKSRWTLETDSMWLTQENLATNFLTTGAFEYTDGCEYLVHAGPVDGWPLESYAFDSEQSSASVSWEFQNLWNPRGYELEIMNLGNLVSPAESPLLTLQDLGTPYYDQTQPDFGCLILTTEYDTPVPTWDWQGPLTTTLDLAYLCRCLEVQQQDLLQERSFPGPDGLLITTSFYWQPEPPVAAGWTAPVVEWVETVIEGLTSQPIVLHDYFAQTYKPEHHNFSEHFIFDPFLDLSVPTSQLDELSAQGIRLIHVFDEFGVLDFAFYSDAGICECNLLPYGDVDASGTADLDDLTCMLDGLNGQWDCFGAPPEAMDIHPCGGGDAEADLRDLLALLDSLAGAPQCLPSCQ